MSGHEFLAPRFESIPPELIPVPRWLLWRAEGRPGEKPRKVPYCPLNPQRLASATDPLTWGSFEQARSAYLRGGFTGIGFVLNGDGLAGIDIDRCVIGGRIDPAATELLRSLNVGYTELSPSGTGLRAFGAAESIAKGVNGKVNGLSVELYSAGRYLTLTGHCITPGGITRLNRFGELADFIDATRKVTAAGSDPTNTTSPVRQAHLVQAILSGEVFHDSLRDLAASLIATGMHPGAAVSLLRALMEASTAPHDERWSARLAEIPRLVSSAAAKFGGGAANSDHFWRDFARTREAAGIPRRQLLEPFDARMYDPTLSEELAAAVDAGQLLAEAEPQLSSFSLVPFAHLGTAAAMPPEFVWEGLVPSGHVTLLGAHGGTGKSMVALMLAVAVALGIPLFGIPTRAGNVAFFSGEDGGALLQYRLRHICHCMGVPVESLDGRLFLLDATNGDPSLFTEVTTAGRKEGTTTQTYSDVRQFCDANAIDFLVVDNASDTFDASEIDRARVRGFIRSLARIARERDAGVLLLAHVDKGTSRGERSGSEGYSGSTAWNNSPRSRLFMSRDGDGALLIEHQKHNLGPRHQPLHLSWPEGGIPKLDEPVGVSVQSAGSLGHEKALVNLIAEYTERGEFVPTALTSRTNAGKLLGREPGFRKMKPGEVFDLLRTAERAGYLERITYKGSDRHPRERWGVTPAGRHFAGLPVLPAVTAATSDVTAANAPTATPAAPAATSPPRGVGGYARAGGAPPTAATLFGGEQFGASSAG